MTTIKVTDAFGDKFEVEAGADGKTPVTPDNPPAKAELVDTAEDDTEAVSDDPLTTETSASVEETDADETEEEEDARPAGNASRADWVAFAQSEAGGSMTDEDLEGKGRDEIRDLYGE